MILKGISVNQDPPTKDHLWITPKGNTRFWDQSTWRLIGGSGGTVLPEIEAAGKYLATTGTSGNYSMVWADGTGGNYLPLSGGTMTGSINLPSMGNNNLVGIKSADSLNTSVIGYTSDGNPHILAPTIVFGDYVWSSYSWIKFNVTRGTNCTKLAIDSCERSNNYPLKMYVNTDGSTGSEALNVGGWVGTIGSTGWYNSTYQGGWYMSDANWIRSYNNKPVQISIANNNAWGIGTHRLGLAITGTSHVSWLLNSGNVGYGFCVNTDGNWYFGKRTSGSLTDTSGDSYLYYGNQTHFSPSPNNTIDLGIDSHKWKIIRAGTGILSDGYVTALQAASSDKRLKKEIKPFNAKQIIDKLKPVEFEWNKKANKYNSNLELNKKNYGLIAQDSDGIIDNLVFDLPDGKGYKGVRYEKLIPILLQAVKEQQKEIDELKQIIKKMKV